MGGGYPERGLSDQALIWMIARMQALTNLEFDIAAVRASTKPNLTEPVVDSTEGWVIDHAFPHYRTGPTTATTLSVPAGPVTVNITVNVGEHQ